LTEIRSIRPILTFTIHKLSCLRRILSEDVYLVDNVVQRVACNTDMMHLMY